MRNYYPLQSAPAEAVPYTVHVFLRGGTGYCEHFDSYSAANDYYDTFKVGGTNWNDKVTHVSMRPTPAWQLTD